MNGTTVSSQDHQYDSNEEKTTNQLYSSNPAVIKSEVDEAVVKEEYVDPLSTNVFQSNSETIIKIEKFEVEDSSDWTLSIPEHLSTEQLNSGALIKLEVKEIKENCHFKSEIKLEADQDLTVIKNEDVDPFSTGWVESNCDTTSIKIEKTEVEKRSDFTFSNSELLSTSVGKSNIENSSSLDKPKSRKIIHGGEKRFQCELCLKSFSQSADLKTHKMVHTGERPFQCEVCSKTFTRPKYLKVHKMVHTGERPFKCELCLKTFTKKGVLKDHKLIHTGVRAFQCEICLKTFSQTGHLITHKRTHSNERPFQCEICLKKFRLPGYLKTHKMTHTGERPFQCEICLKTFLESGTLSRHKMTHSSERPFQCDICLKTFSLSGTLKRHKLTHKR